MKTHNLNLPRLIAAIVVLLFISFNLYLFSAQPDYHELVIHNHRGKFTMQVELARSFREMQQGLMFRRRLDVGKGMLFVYKQPIIPSFWMKNTWVPLDMIFIGEDQKIKFIHEKVPPCAEGEDCPSYRPDQPVLYVLEVPGGYSSLFKLNPGDFVEIPDVE